MLAEVHTDLEKRNGVTKASKFLFDHVSKVCNAMSIQPQEGACLLSTNNTAKVIFKGEESKDTTTYLSSVSISIAVTRSKWT